ncbi:hypothetical protein [Natrarchaeobius chitinivorans]|uniref:Uncharacterized protein n=1 Tax=Natrarchaeobius chitinivorans TaxID=1679083 RepID=A0A3N6N1J2_NATCH|nr:hypothetical protein [Natrarchaeobius chitinivorans]RQG91852.1 hypothetical protein EA473_18885 [Natrarchaeobius chitinivorans]
MAEVPAREALEYATSDEFLTLYGGFLVSWALLAFERITRGILPVRIPLLESLVSSGIVVLSATVFVITVVAILHKVAMDCRREEAN